MSEERTSEPIPDDVVQRLRASSGKRERQDYAAGWEAGSNWAKSAADAGDLELFDKAWQEEMEQDWGRHFAPDGANMFTLYWTIFGAEEDNEDAEESFWKAARRGKTWPRGWKRNDGFLHGFFDGARDVWGKVKDRL